MIGGVPLNHKHLAVKLISAAVSAAVSLSSVFAAAIMTSGHSVPTGNTANITDMSEISSAYVPALTDNNGSELSSTDIITTSESQMSVTSEPSEPSQNSSSAVSPPEEKEPDPVVQDVPFEDLSFGTAVWYSYTNVASKGLTKKQYTKKIGDMFAAAKELGANRVICHVRAFADAFYDSDLFPYSSYVAGNQGTGIGYDPLEIMVKEAHSRGLYIEAWINPYRVSKAKSSGGTGTDEKVLSAKNPAKKWMSSNATARYVLEWGGALYFNPAVPQVRSLIIDGVREILDNYDVDGIHMDDYFYPSIDESVTDFDGPEYDIYAASAESPLSRGDWRRANVNTLVSGIYALTKSYGKIFGISPSYHVSSDGSDDNYKYAYADIALWMGTEGYIDYIAPQLYFGYEYSLERCHFDNLLKTWLSIKRIDGVKLYIGLAAYKIDTVDAKTNEWKDHDDILSRQAIDCFSGGCDGIFLYDHNSLFKSGTLFVKEREYLKQALDKIKSQL